MARHKERAGRKPQPGKRLSINGEPTKIRHRRPWLVFGPGLAVALLAAAVMLWSGRRAAGPGPGFHPALPPGAEPGLSRVPPPAPAPDLAFVLRQTRPLALSGRQAQKLAALEQQFERDTAGPRARLQQASDDFSRGMRDRAGKGIMLTDLQERAAAVSQLSRQLAAARRCYWARAAQIMTPVQRTQAEALWARKLTGGLHGHPS